MIPLAPLLLGLAGTIPFIAAAALMSAPDKFMPHIGMAAFSGPIIMAAYGRVILCFMSGVLWGFATKATGIKAALAYTASVIPALYVFFATSLGTTFVLIPLAAGYLVLLAFDFGFHLASLTPPWWMKLRLLITAIVLVCFYFAIRAQG